jgi:hypothetical protein
MPVYLVTYDLIAKKGEVRDYQPLYEVLENFPNFEALYSVYLVEANSGADIESVISPVLRDSDRYFITRLRKSEYRSRAAKGINAWLAAHPPA